MDLTSHGMAAPQAPDDAARVADIDARSIVETMQEALLVLAPDLRVCYANPAFLEHFRVTEAATVGRRVYELGNGQWNIPELRTLLEDILPTCKVFNDYQVAQAFDGLGACVMLLNARQLDHVQLILLGIRDVTRERKVENALRESEVRYRVLVQAFSQAVWETNGAGVGVADSPSWRAYSGQTLEDWLGHGWVDAIHPDDRAHAERRWREAVAVRGNVNTEFRLRGPDGAWRWTNLLAAPVLGPDGQVLKWVGMNVDVTARKRAEEALQASEQQLASMFNVTSVGMAQCDPVTRRFLRVNAALCRLTGYSESELLALTVDDLNHPEDRARDRGHYRALADDRVAYGVEKRYRRKDGATVWVQATGDVARNVDGTPTRAFAVIQDITERKTAEAALHAQRERLEALIRSAPLGVAYFDREHRYVQINDGLAALNGLSSAAHVGRRISEVVPDFAALAAVQIDRVFATGEAVGNVEMTGRTPRVPGVTRQFLTGFYPVKDASGGVTLCGCWATEITELKQAEQNLRESDRRKDRFLATLAHELRNPLAPIRNAVQILNRVGSPDVTAQRARDMIARQTDHLVRLVDDLLEVSRITLGKLELRRERVALGGIIEQAVDAVWPHVERVGVELAVSLPHPMTLDADPVRLVQVFANLLTNACKYTDAGGHIRLAAERQAGFAVVSVRDDGIGIAPERLGCIFEMFSQDEGAMRRSEGGLGIGLALSKGLVELHGGTIEAHSKGPGQGSEFVVRLPLAEDLAADDESADRSGDARAGTAAGRRVLVVDDNQDAADSLAALLRLEGADVAVAYGGAEALRVAARFDAQLVLLDLGMPGMDGFEVCRALRDRSTRPVKIVALTGWGQEDDRRRSLQAGFDGHLVKPVAFGPLAALLKALAD